MKRYPYVILGGGVAAGYAAQVFAEARDVDKQESLCIVCAEDRPPYERPPLSKTFLVGEEDVDDIWINPPEFYEQHNIDLLLGERVLKVDFDQRVLHTADQEIGFDKLMIATGSQVKRLSVAGNELENIFYLRSLADAGRIREAAGQAQRAVVIGGSFIGMETASSLRRLGLETTLVFPESHVWANFFTERMSSFFEKYYEERGVTLEKEAEVSSFQGEGAVQAVKLKDGRELPADIVVAGVGVTPNLEIFASTPLEIQEGVLVNRYLETNIPGVYAVGDVATYPDAYLGEQRRVEHWDNAYAQGRQAMRNMVGARKPYQHLPYFFSDVFDLSYEFWGDTSDHDTVIYRGALEESEASFSVWWLQKQRLVAAFVMNRPEEEREAAQLWLKSGIVAPEEQLRNTEGGLAKLMTQPNLDNTPL